MFMGLFARMLGVRRVLFADLRDGDVTVWNQSYRLATMGLYGPRRCNDKSRIAFCLAAIRN